MRGAREALKGDYAYVLFMDSDLTNPPEHIARFLAPIAGGADLVKGTRFSLGGDMNAVPWSRRIYSLTGNAIARLLFRMGLADCTNGFRAVRTQLFLDMPLKERGFAVIAEELYWAKRRNALVAEVPTTLTARSSDLRPTLFGYRPAIFWGYLKYALLAALVPYRPETRYPSSPPCR
jgi:hypothetical protein